MEGFKNALETFKWAAANIPAYRSFLKRNKINSAEIKTSGDFKLVPVMDKINYLRAYPYDNLFPNRDIPPVVSMSSGSSGQPFYWARGMEHEKRGGEIHEIIFRDIFQIGKKNTLVIVCFSMGTWIAGVFTATSSKYVANNGYNLTVATPGIEKEDILSLLRDFAPNFQRVILTGYPPFLMDVIVEARRRKINLKKMDLRLLFAGESFSEHWRSIIHKLAYIKKPIGGSINVYGSADADLLGHETPLSIYLRKKTLTNKKFMKTLFGDIPFVPTLVQYYPRDKFFESADGELIFTAKSGIPLMRYNIHDKGKILTIKSVEKALKESGLLKEAKKYGLKRWRMPFLTLGGRSDVAVTFYALNIYPENIKAGLEDRKVAKYLSGKFIAENKTVNRGKDQKLIITVELRQGVRPSKKLETKLRESIFRNFVKLNIEYRKLYASIGTKALPVVNLMSFGNPIFEVRKSKHKWIKRS